MGPDRSPRRYRRRRRSRRFRHCGRYAAWGFRAARRGRDQFGYVGRRKSRAANVHGQPQHTAPAASADVEARHEQSHEHGVEPIGHEAGVYPSARANFGDHHIRPATTGRTSLLRRDPGSARSPGRAGCPGGASGTTSGCTSRTGSCSADRASRAVGATRPDLATGATTDRAAGANFAAKAGSHAAAEDLEGVLAMRTFAWFTAAVTVGILVGNGYAGEAGQRLLDATGPHGAWYASRAAGVASYLFLWLGLVGGLMMSSAWFDGIVGRARLLAIHQSASIAGVLLGLGHGLVLTQDQWTHFGLYDVLVPFGSYYKTFLTAIGTLVLYLSAVVSASFWFRRRMGTKAWKWLHYSSFAAFAGAFWHGMMTGTDSHEPWLMGVYLGTTLAVIFGVMIRVTYRRPAVKRQPVTLATEARAA